MPSPEEKQTWTEENKLVHDTLKQLVTISSGLILIVNAFLGKLGFPLSKFLIGFSFAGFFTCIVLSLFLMRNISVNVTVDPKHLPPKDIAKYEYAKRSFLLAVGLLVFVFIANLPWR